MGKKLMRCNRSPAGRIVLVILLFVLMGIVFSLFDSKKYIILFFAWLESHDTLATPVFIVVNMLFVIFVLPGVFLTLGAGFMFGVVQGSFCMLISTTAGSVIAFVIGRYFLVARISDYFLSHPRLQLLNTKFSGTGWKGVFFTRIIPFFPFKLSNYFFGLARFSLRDFAIGTFFGIMPFTFFNVYLGSLAADLATLGVRHSERSAGQWFLYGAGFLVTVSALICINRVAQRVLSQYGLDKKSGGRSEDSLAAGDSQANRGESS